MKECSEMELGFLVEEKTRGLNLSEGTQDWAIVLRWFTVAE